MGIRLSKESAPPGNDFAAQLCRDWENEALRISALGSQVSLIRIGIVLERDGGALGQMLPAFRFGVGGRFGNGQHWMSWMPSRRPHQHDHLAYRAWSAWGLQSHRTTSSHRRCLRSGTRCNPAPSYAVHATTAATAAVLRRDSRYDSPSANASNRDEHWKKAIVSSTPTSTLHWLQSCAKN